MLDVIILIFIFNMIIGALFITFKSKELSKYYVKEDSGFKFIFFGMWLALTWTFQFRKIS